MKRSIVAAALVAQLPAAAFAFDKWQLSAINNIAAAEAYTDMCPGLHLDTRFAIAFLVQNGIALNDVATALAMTEQVKAGKVGALSGEIHAMCEQGMNEYGRNGSKVSGLLMR